MDTVLVVLTYKWRMCAGVSFLLSKNKIVKNRKLLFAYSYANIRIVSLKYYFCLEYFFEGNRRMKFGCVLVGLKRTASSVIYC